MLSANSPAAVTEPNPLGSRFVRRLLPLLQQWHRQARDRSQPDLRSLQADQYGLLIAHGLFTPLDFVVREVRQTDDLRRVQQWLGCARAAEGSRDDAVELFDAARLQSIAVEVGLPPPLESQASRLAAIPPTQLILEPGFLRVLPQILLAGCRTGGSDTGVDAWQLPAQIHRLCRSSPPGAGIRSSDPLAPDPGRLERRPAGSPEGSPEASPGATLPPDQLTIWTGSFAEVAWIQSRLSGRGSHLGLLGDDGVRDLLEERPLSDADRAAGITSDQRVRLPSAGPGPEHGPTARVLEITLPARPAPALSSEAANATADDRTLRVITDLLDPPAEVVGWLARCPATTEFSWKLFRHILGCRSVLEADPDSREIGIHVYWSIVGCLLIALYAAGKPTTRTRELITLFLGGLADEGEFLEHVARLKPPGEAKRRR